MLFLHTPGEFTELFLHRTNVVVKYYSCFEFNFQDIYVLYIYVYNLYIFDVKNKHEVKIVKIY